MAIHIWCIVASVLLASTGAEIYDQGPQTFFESSSPSPQALERGNREFVLFLTPNQVQALESGGAYVKPQEAPEPEAEKNEAPEVSEEQNGSQPEEGDNSEEEQTEDSELEEIFKILNQQKFSENEEQQTEEPTTQKPREIPQRFKATKSQQEEKKYYAPTPKKLGPARSYSYVRFLPTHESENLKSKTYSFEKNEESAENEGSQEESRPENTPESEKQNEDKILSQLIPYLQHQKIAASIVQQKQKLVKSELDLQTKLRELQDVPKYNDQKFAIEIEKLRSNLEKQNALSKVEAIAAAKAAPVLIKEEISVKKRRPVEAVKHVKVPVPSPVIVRVPQPFEVKVPQPYPVPLEIVRQVPVPIVKNEKVEVEKPFPVEVEQRAPFTVTKNVFVRVNKPYLVERIVPVEVKKEVPVEVPIHKPQKLTIVRHIWEH